jgi:hypothetical protein
MPGLDGSILACRRQERRIAQIAGHHPGATTKRTNNVNRIDSAGDFSLYHELSPARITKAHRDLYFDVGGMPEMG